jgi:hypothetical protein
VPEIPPETAVMIATPGEIAVMTPAAFTTATAVLLLVKPQPLVTTAVVPSLNVPTTVIAAVVPEVMILTACTVIAVSSAVVSATITTSTCAKTLPETALMMAVPAETAVTIPVLLTTATAVLLELYTTPDVSTAEVPPTKSPVAVSWAVAPTKMELAAEVSVMDSSTSAPTTTSVVLLTPLHVPVMMAVPADTAVTTPVLLTTATAVLLEVNTTPETSVEVVLSLKDPTTVN